MAKTRQQKEELLKEVEGLVAGKATVFTGFSKLSVKELTDLRGQLRAAGSNYKVAKNTLLKKALADKGVEIPTEIFDVQLAIATSSTDEVEPNKIVVNFAKGHENLKILGAIVDNKFVDESGVKALATLPSRDELYAKVVGSIAAPLSGLVNVMSGNLRGLVNVLNQIKEQKA